MKRKIISKMVAAVLFLTIVLMACSRGTDGGSSGSQYYIRMSVDGTAKSGVASTAYLSNYTATVGGVQQNLKQLIISSGGFGGNAAETVTLSMSDFIGPGTYSLAVDNPSAVAQYAKMAYDPNQVYGKESGKIVITDYNTSTVKGTYEFIGKSSNGTAVNITKGEFYLPVSTK